MLRRMFIAFGVMLGLLVPPQAFAAELSIREYKSITTIGSLVAQIAPEPGTDQTPVDFSGGAASSAAFAASTKVTRLICDVKCSIKFGASPQTATTSNSWLAAGIPEYFAVIPGQIVSVVTKP